MSFHGVKDEGSFKTHAPYLREAFDGGTKVTQLAKAKLGSKDFGTKHEDAKVGTFEEYCDPRVAGQSCMIRSYCELYFGEQHDGGSFVRALNFASHESIGRQYMGVAYHRGGIPSASTSESRGGT
ncbi:hypothetical protein BHM03_00044782 [Ensete ventricosum]|nr:hypothetical protein BHM03_00044782 [Ensete ventricosum]